MTRRDGCRRKGPHGGSREGSGRRRRLCGCRAISVTLDSDSISKLDAWCDSTGLTRSAQLRALLRRVPEPNRGSKPNG